MATFVHGHVTINYEEHGSGFPVLLIAPGGMRSALGYWENTPWNPIEHLSADYRVIAMDQRNAGASTAPVTADDGWDSYTADQLALLDHLGVDEFAVLGMCIGGAYIVNLARTAPDRVVAGVALQPIGLDDNASAFHEMMAGWVAEQEEHHPEADEATWESFGRNMYGGDKVLFTATAEEAAEIQTPLLVLMGNDLYHPSSASRLLVDAAPNATLIEEWKEGPTRDEAMEAVAGFLAAHSG